MQRITSLTRPQIQHALWELATAGLAAADGFDQLRAMMDPRRKSVSSTIERKTRSSAGRWSLLCEEVRAAPSRLEQARRTDAALESAAKMLLARYGIIFRDLLVRESNVPKWRDLLNVLRRLEARGEVRGGRFLSGFGGEQFALPEAVESLRAARNLTDEREVTVAAADPMNLSGIVVPGDRIPSVPGKTVRYRNGSVIMDENSEETGTTNKLARRLARVPSFAAISPARSPDPEPVRPSLF